jgi:DNA-binding response OmpR family regulator
METMADNVEHTPVLRSEVDQKKKTILLYSPDLNFCFSLSMLFQDRYNVVTTTNLGMLEKFVASYSADLVMIDAVPSESIVERLAGLKEVSKKLPIIMLYVYNAKDVRLDQAIRTQVDSVFYKPFEINTVSRRIDDLLKP